MIPAQMAHAQGVLHDAIASAFTKGPDPDVLAGGMVVGWVVVAEFIGADGDRWCDVLGNEDSRVWQLDGYATELLDRNRRARDREAD